MSRTSTRYRLLALLGVTLAVNIHPAAAGNLRSVAELFTSQGCSSCPPADAVAGQLLDNDEILILSFHVDYWDDLRWKDTFSSRTSTERQYAYARSLGERSVFTPQLVLNGMRSLVGSQETRVQQAVAAATETDFPLDAQLTPLASGAFKVVLEGPQTAADVWEVRYVHRSVTKVRGGENGGRDLQTFNNVTQLRHIGSFSARAFELPPLRGSDDGIAVLIQAPQTGRVLGAAAYLKVAAKLQ
jgi:hypothetical protein